MPNYSHGTKLTLASAEEPPYLTIGTDVSAKYKGAFCEAKITDVNKHVKLRVLFEGSNGTYLIDDTDLKAGTALETGARIEAKHPEKKQSYVPATVTKILDHSRYTVVFDDGDQCVLRRNSLCIKSGKHFAESETLDQLPLTNPEHFGNPVKVGAIEQLNNSNAIQSNTSKAQNNHQLLNDKPKGKSSSTNSSSTNSSSTTSDETKSIVNAKEGKNNRKRPHQQDCNSESNKKLKKESNASNNTTSVSTGRRGAKGRKRRESVNNGSKHTSELDDDSVDSSLDSGDVNSGDSNVKFELIEIGVKLMVQYGKGKAQNVYEAKVNKIETNSAGKTKYFVHYTGWNNRYDEWITRNRILSIVTEKETGSRDGRSKQSESAATGSSAPSTTTTATVVNSAPTITDSSTSNTTCPVPSASAPSTASSAPSISSNATPTKEKDKDVASKTRRSRQSELSAPSSSAPTTANTTSVVGSAPAITTSSTTITTSSMSSASMVPTTSSAVSISSSAPLVKEKDRDAPSKTRRSRHSELTPSAPLASAITTATAVVTSISAITTTNTVTPAVCPTASSAKAPSVASSTTSVSSSAPSTKDKDRDVPSKTRRSRQMELSASTPPVATAPTTTSVATSVPVITTTTVATTVSPASSGSTPATASTATTTTTCSNAPLTKEKDKDLPSKTRRSRQSELTALAPTVPVTATATVVVSPVLAITTTTTSTPSVASSTTSISSSAPSTKEKDNDSPLCVDHKNLSTSPSSRPVYRFCEEINEPDLDKKISTLQDRIMALRQTYISLRSELNDLAARSTRREQKLVQ